MEPETENPHINQEKIRLDINMILDPNFEDTLQSTYGTHMADGMDNLLDCPFPEVAEALRPFIKSRQEVAAIRKGLQSNLPLSSIDPSRPSRKTSEDLSGLTGLRKSYWRALQAHQAAQAKYDALKTELDQMTRSKDSTGAEDSTSFLTETYIPLLQQKDKHRRLAVIEGTLAKIGSAGGDVATDSFDKVIKRTVGEVPTPPSNTGLSERELGSDAEYDLTRLKKAILSVQQDLKAHKQASARINGVADGEVHPWADLRALQKTHNELTTWMDKQLEIISEGSKDTPAGTTESPDTNDHAPISIRDIEALYEQYLESRQKLLDIVSNPVDDVSSIPGSPEVIRGAPTLVDIETGPNTSEIVLPQITRLVTAKQSEQALLQQSGYTRRQLESAEKQTQAMLTRLADESHLLQPELHRGSPRGAHWLEAGKAAGDATKATTTESIKVGKASAHKASESLETIQSMPRSFDKLLDK